MSGGSSLGNLPGFFWDPVKNRYFPVSQTASSSTPSSSGPRQPTNQRSQKRGRGLDSAPVTGSTSNTFRHRGRDGRGTWRKEGKSDEINRKVSDESDESEVPDSKQANHTTKWRRAHRHLKLCLSYTERAKAEHDLRMIDMTSRLSSEPKPAPTPSIIGASTTAFVSSRQCYTSTLNDWGNRPIRFIGDNQGWLYSYIDPPQTVWEQSPVEVLSEINLHPHGELSSISLSENLCIATCFGPTTRISVQSLHEPSRTTIITLPSVHDVRCSTILPSSAHVLGAAKRAIHINSPEIRHGIRELHTGSDVFSLCNIEEDIIYAGCRNGQISRFDLRITGSKPDALRLPVSKSTPIYLSLLPIPKWEILVGRMDGELCTYDLRFVSTTSETTPTRTFRGHVGGVDHRLGSGISVPPDSEYIFAAGDDGRLRCWSLRAAGMDPQTTVECGRLRCLHTTQEDVEGSTGNQLWGVDTSETRRGIVNWLL